jgi:hypothetical protein
MQICQNHHCAQSDSALLRMNEVTQVWNYRAITAARAEKQLPAAALIDIRKPCCAGDDFNLNLFQF